MALLEIYPDIVHTLTVPLRPREWVRETGNVKNILTTDSCSEAKAGESDKKYYSNYPIWQLRPVISSHSQGNHPMWSPGIIAYTVAVFPQPRIPHGDLWLVISCCICSDTISTNICGMSVFLWSISHILRQGNIIRLCLFRAVSHLAQIIGETW